MRPGLRVGEALARCPGARPGGGRPGRGRRGGRAHAGAPRGGRVRGRADRARTAPPSTRAARCACTAASTGCCAGCARRCRWAPTAGWAPPRRSSPPSRRPARPRPGRPLVLAPDEVAEFLAPLPADRLPLAPELVARPRTTWGFARSGQVAALPAGGGPRAPGLPRPARRGAWPAARPAAPRARAPRRGRCGRRSPSPSPSAALPALEAAARLLLGELAGGGARARRRPAQPRPARAPGRRRIVGARPHPARGHGRPRPAGARGPPPARRDHRPGHRAVDRRGRLGRARPGTSSRPSPRRPRSAAPGPREAIRQVRAAQGQEAMLRAVEIEPWSRLPERRWALTPYEP